MKVHTITDGTIPSNAEPGTVYHFPADHKALALYTELTDRTRGWLTPTMITNLSKSHVAIAGVGGIGGHVADSLIRAGVGHISIADPSEFDYSNIHRQHGAHHHTVGVSKALATTKVLLETVQSTHITAYPMGVCKTSIDHFLNGVDLVVDAVEFHAIGSRCLLHTTAKEKGIPILNGNSVGFSTHLFLFSPDRAGLCDAFPFSLDLAQNLEYSCLNGTISEKEYRLLCTAIMKIFLPNIPNYGDATHDTRKVFIDRLMHERTASIISTNPKMAAGILSNQVLLSLTESNTQLVGIPTLSPFPDYHHYDAALKQSSNQSLHLKTIHHELMEHMHS